MKLESRKYIFTGITPTLGSQPSDPNIHSTYIGSRAPAPWQSEQETEMVANANMADEKGMTIFFRDKDGRICLLDYMIMGFLKESVNALSGQLGVKMAKSKINTYVFAFPRIIPILKDGKAIYHPDGVKERTLRAETMQGPRTTLASSEMVNDPWEIHVEIRLLENAGTAKSKAITWDVIEEALDYGSLKGISQWRNGSYGRFTWRREE